MKCAPTKICISARIFSVFGQFLSGLEERRIGGPRPQTDENVFDLHQGFLGVKLPLNDRNSLTVAWSGKS
jgi:hypothetical protein